MPTPAQLVLIMLVVLFLAGAWLLLERPVKNQDIPAPIDHEAEARKAEAKANSHALWWESRDPGRGVLIEITPSTKAAPLSAQVHAEIRQAQARDASNNWDYKK